MELEVLHFKEFEDVKKCWHECSLGVYLVIDNFGGYRAF